MTNPESFDMEAVKKTVTFTDEQDARISMQVENSEYTNDSEYLGDLLRQDQEKREQFERIKAAIRSGLESGVSNERIDDIWANAEKRVRDKKSNAPL